MANAIFDTWTDRYDQWFETPSGKLIKQYESDLLLTLLDPQPGETILDVGCGTGMFTRDVMASKTNVIGIDLSCPMLKIALDRLNSQELFRFSGACADMCALPFPDDYFDRVFSMTAIEFVEDAQKAVAELDRVARKGGCIVLTTLNSLSPWADRRKKKAKQGHQLFEHIFFRSPEKMRALIPQKVDIRTAIHFQKETPVSDIPGIEADGREKHLDTGAFLAVRWQKS